MKRRSFIKNTGITGLGITAIPTALGFNPINEFENMQNKFPLTIATWPKRFPKGRRITGQWGHCLDAVEQGVMIEEANLKNTTVGKGGAPDREGNVTLDACIMAPDGNAGSVAYLKNNTHAVSVARKVMEETPHVMLIGEDANQFAQQQGFEKEELLTEESEKAYLEWLKKSRQIDA